MRRFIQIVENAQEGVLTEAYDLGQWKRWWANMRTGEIIPVEGQQHDETLLDNLEEFFNDYEIDELLDGADDAWERLDPILLAAYAKGWQAVLYDGNKKSLSIRTGTAFSPARVAAVASDIAASYPVDEVVADFEDTGKWVTLRGDDLERFLKRGVIPRRTV